MQKTIILLLGLLGVALASMSHVSTKHNLAEN
jgi:hypothetical protein